MAMLPRYQRLGVNAAQPRELDFANLREGVKQSQTISDVVGQMSDFVYKKAAASAERQGQEAVRDQGAQTVLGRIAKGGGPKNIAERAAYAFGSRIASAEIQNDAEVEISRILSDGERNKTPLSSIQAQLADVTDGYSAVMSNIDAETATVLRTNLTGASGKASARYADWYAGVLEAQTKVKLSNAVSLGTANIKGNAVLPGVTFKEILDDIAIEAEKLSALGVSEKELQVWEQSTYTQALKENVTYSFVQGDLNEKRQIISSLDKEPLFGLDYTETQSFKKSLSAEMSAGIAIAKGQASDVEDLIGDQEDILTGGGMPDPEKIADLVTQIDNLGEFGAKAQGMIVSLADKMQLSDVYRRMTPSDLKNEVDALAFGIPGEGKTGLDTLAETERLAFATKMLDTMRTEIKKDPNGYAARSGMTYIDPADGKTKRVEVKPINFSDPSSWSDRVTVARVVASKYSQPPKYFSPEELTGLNTVLETGDRLAKQGILAAVVSSGGNVAPDLLREIAPNNPEFAQIGALSLSGSQSAADAALRGMEVLAAGNDLPGFTPTNTQLPFGEMMGQSMTFLPTSRGLIEKTARLIYADKVQKNGYTEFEENAWKMSIQEAAGSNGEFGGIQMVGAVATLIPTDITAEQFNKAMDNLDLLTIGIMTVTPKMADGQLVSQEMINAIKENYEVYAIGNGQYRFIMGNPGVQGFKVAADEYGNEIRFNPSLLMGR
jgi:hypothetical protein